MRFGGLIAAIVFAAIAAVIVLRMSANEAPPPQTAAAPAPEVKSVPVYVAASPIPIGATITQEMVTSQPWPEHLVLDGFMKAVQGGASPVGMVARAPFQTQEPIISSKVSNGNDPNFLAASLPKGMRVVTIETNEIQGLAGFLFPGDHIDILLTHDVPKWVVSPNGGQPQEDKDSVTETLLTNVTVLAVDQRSTAAGATDKDGKLVSPHSVSLMASPTDVQRLVLGARKGTLSLSLRALADRESADPLIITGIKDISQYEEPAAALPGANNNDGVVIVRGTQREQLKGDQPASPAAGAAAALAGAPAHVTNTTLMVNPNLPSQR